jgi:23S rRNA pseudouridine2605 synthase
MDTGEENNHKIKAEAGRIAKHMARAGVCSRRDAERLIADRRVTLNGVVVESPAVNVTDADVICVDGRRVAEPEKTRLWRYHKPKGQVTTAHDPGARETVFDKLPADLPRLIAVGRLDYNTEGLLLFTNDGGLSRHLELPATGWIRRYRVRVNGRPAQDALDALKNGLELDGVRYGAIEARLDAREQAGANAWLTVSIREGKNREVRKVMEHLGLKVTRLIRTSFGPFGLGELPPGHIEEVRTRVLAEQLGPALAAEFGLKAAASGALKPEPRIHARAFRDAAPAAKPGAERKPLARPPRRAVKPAPRKPRDGA